MEDWYQIPVDIIDKSLRKKFGSTLHLLQFVYPQHPWITNDSNSNSTSTSTSTSNSAVLDGEEGRNQDTLILPSSSGGISKFQRVLYKAVEELFPDQDIRMEYNHPNLKHKGNGSLSMNQPRLMYLSCSLIYLSFYLIIYFFDIFPFICRFWPHYGLGYLYSRIEFGI